MMKVPKFETLRWRARPTMMSISPAHVTTAHTNTRRFREARTNTRWFVHAPTRAGSEKRTPPRDGSAMKRTPTCHGWALKRPLSTTRGSRPSSPACPLLFPSLVPSLYLVPPLSSKILSGDIIPRKVTPVILLCGCMKRTREMQVSVGHIHFHYGIGRSVQGYL